MERLKGRLRQAYKKLKASVYGDKAQTILRRQIAEYETDGDIEERISIMAESICKDFEKYQEEAILQNMSIFSFPKKISNMVSKNDKGVIVNAPPKVKIDSLNYFIDLPVEGHILGILWVMEIGSILDSELYEKSYGNRLRKEFRDEEKHGNGLSPHLFKRYFAEYELWWNKALDSAKSLMNENKDALILCMDLSKFYYSVSFTEEDFSDMFKKYEDRIETMNAESLGNADYCYNVVKPLNKFVFNVLKDYGRKLCSRMKEHVADEQCLPIGFSPSCILSNYKLKNMDCAILDRLSPTYYGRYVDDLLIVLSVDKISKIREIIQKENNEIKLSTVLKLYFGREKSSTKNRIYFVNNEHKSKNVRIYIDNKKTNFKINADKVQCFYFYSERTDALIDAFKKHLSENTSGFNLMPEESTDMEKIDRIYNLRRTEVSKFRGVENIEISKLELSKLIGKQMVTSNITKEHNHPFLKSSLKIFDESVILDNYALWENMFTYYVINDECDYIIEFTKLILNSLNNLYVEEENDYDKNIKTMNVTLMNHFISSLSRALSLRVGNYTKKFLTRLSEELLRLEIKHNWFKTDDAREQIEKLYVKFYKSGYFNRSLTPALILRGLEIDEKNMDVKLYRLDDVVSLYRVAPKDARACKFGYYPLVISPFDIKILKSLFCMMDGDSTNSEKNGWGQISQDYCSINFDQTKTKCTLLDDAVCYVERGSGANGRCCAIKVGNIKNEKQNRFKIAIANTNAIKDELKNVLTGELNRSLKRYNYLTNVVNQAIKENADILILPETYVPFDWLKLLSKKSKNMAIITGVEHLKFEDKIYNLTATILPFRGDAYKYSFLEFHNKVHYSPAEEELIEGYRCQPVRGERYEIFCWKDIWFAPYCCYEITSIRDRSLFRTLADLIVVVECNRDVNYFGSIMESLSRDLHCYCAQVNSSIYGDSRITQPTDSERRDIVRTKGGRNHTVIVDTIDLDDLRDFQLKEHSLQKEDNRFKYTPPDFENKDLLKRKISGTLFDEWKEKYHKNGQL